MATESSAISLTSNFYMQNYYRYNRAVIKTSARQEYSTSELSYEDTRALKRAIAKLEDFDYDDSENLENLINSVKAFAETYNFTLDSCSSKDSSAYRQMKQLKKLSKEYESEFKKLGITFEEDGKMSVSDSILENSTIDEFKNVFSKDTGYLDSMKTIAKRMNNKAYDDVYTQMTGCGGKLNILL